MALPTYNDIKDLVKKGLTVEAQEKIIELREAALERQDENIELKEKVKELEEALKIKGSVVYEAPYYFTEKNGKRDGPFCQNCYDGSEKLIRLQETGQKGCWKCHCCEKGVTDSNYKPPPSPKLPRIPSKRRW